MEERRSTPYCNLFMVHCKDAFERIEKKLDKIDKVIENFTPDHVLNTNHRKWMESWGRAILVSVSISALGSVAWVIMANAK